jgi:hypothetical protein
VSAVALACGSLEGWCEVAVQFFHSRSWCHPSDVNWLVDLRSEATLPAVVRLPIGRGPLQLVAIPAECASSSSGAEDHRKEGTTT